MSCRTNHYLRRNELVRIQLDDVLRRPANGHQVQKLADGTAYGADRATVIDGAHSLVQDMTIKSGGKIVYDTDNLHKVVNLKNLLEYSEEYSRSVAKNSLWYLDTDHRIANANQTSGFEARRPLTTGNNDVNVILPLNRYSFFEELMDRMLPRCNYNLLSNC